jgi:hypothetical protein
MERPAEARGGNPGSDLQAAYRLKCREVLDNHDDVDGIEAKDERGGKQTKHRSELIATQPYGWISFLTQMQRRALAVNLGAAYTANGGKVALTTLNSNVTHAAQEAHAGAPRARGAARPWPALGGSTAGLTIVDRLRHAKLVAAHGAHSGIVSSSGEKAQMGHAARTSPANVPAERGRNAVARQDDSRDDGPDTECLVSFAAADIRRTYVPIPLQPSRQARASRLSQRPSCVADGASVEKPSSDGANVSYRFMTWDGHPIVDLRFHRLVGGAAVTARASHLHAQAAMERSVDQLALSIAIEFVHRRHDDEGRQPEHASTDSEEDADR